MFAVFREGAHTSLAPLNEPLADKFCRYFEYKNSPFIHLATGLYQLQITYKKREVAVWNRVICALLLTAHLHADARPCHNECASATIDVSGSGIYGCHKYIGCISIRALHVHSVYVVIKDLCYIYNCCKHSIVLSFNQRTFEKLYPGSRLCYLGPQVISFRNCYTVVDFHKLDTFAVIQPIASTH